MRDAHPKAIYLKDYKVPDFLIDATDLQFQLHEEYTEVFTCLQLRRNADAGSATAALVLDGADLELLSLSLNEKTLTAEDYLIQGEQLTIKHVPDQFTLHCHTRIKPHLNTSLEGLYKSRKLFCTQCEAEGFRKITYYLDRPDVMSIFMTTIEADAKSYPVLLSNGNLIEQGQAENGRHWVRWQDPFKKPSYLFALVAGDLSSIEDKFLTQGGSEVTLRIYVEEKDIDKCDHAMLSLKHAMAWDEKVYGREYDLNIFNIVAVDDFNMGAMENKSLNIFNTSCILADPKTTTDSGFQRVEAVVAHEYFHNWSGNRVTCRDWFQLSLKEGFTVFRDAEFSADMGSRVVKRVEDVALLRTVQFAEDGGPMAHPIRPDSFIEISNFYTVTIYEKGAEVVRMISQLLGPELFRRGTDLYFERHDGQAVTCEDFVVAMEDASGRDLQEFRRWYSQAGTPRLDISGDYDSAAKTYTLSVEQSCPSTPGQPNKELFNIPLAMGLLGEAGALALHIEGETPANESSDNTHCVLNVTEQKQQWIFTGITEAPVPSLLRGFSAPVKLEFDYSTDELLRLVTKDDDGYCRWNAMQQLGVMELRKLMASSASEFPALDTRVIDACRGLLADETLDKSMVAMMLQLPSEAYVAELSQCVEVHAIHSARQQAKRQIAMALTDSLWRVYNREQITAPYQASADQIASRALKNVALDYLMTTASPSALEACKTQYTNAGNMTDQSAALTMLVNSDFEVEKQEALDDFYRKWQHESLVVNQWLSIQATAQREGALERVQGLMQHPAFDLKNPNKVRALITAFCTQNHSYFHRDDGAGYAFLADQVIALNTLNPQIAARLLLPLTKWQRYPELFATMMLDQLRRIRRQPTLSKDVFEVIEKSLLDN